MICGTCGAHVHYRIKGRYASIEQIKELRLPSSWFTKHMTHERWCPSFANIL